VNGSGHKNRPGRGTPPNGYQYAASFPDVSDRVDLRTGDKVVVTRSFRNDGTYPHEDIGSILVHQGDLGYVIEIVKSGKEAYYTIEFVNRPVVFETQRQDLIRVRGN
jgi:ATP-dependent exoDNAse (exonuclease V) alpha subunit